MNRQTRTISVLFTLLCIAGSVWAQAPVSIKNMPIYKGATLTGEEIAPVEGDLISAVTRSYIVAAAPEAVVAFYEKACGVRERFGETEDQNELAPGKATNPGCEVYFWDEDYFVDGEYGGGGSSQRAWIKKALKSRARDKDGGWIESANMQWYYRDTASSMTTLHVMIQDMGIDEDKKSYAHSTEIIIEVANYDYEL